MHAAARRLLPTGSQQGYKDSGTYVVATADQVKALIRSHADGDEARFYSVAMQVAAQAARSGHGKFALELRQLVDEVRQRAGSAAVRPGPTPLLQPRGELSGLLTVAYPKARFADMVLAPELARGIERVLVEQREREKLRSHGFSPMRKLLLVGPPGTGKTMTAGALASELGLPLFTIRLDGLITKFMGETAAKLRIVFDAIGQTRAVYLFDELDALGGERSATNDVGEIRRVLNSFLQFLEQDESDSLLVGATNLPNLLDRALFRRFDAVLDYALPSPAMAERIMRARLALLDTSAIAWADALAASAGLSQGELVRACEQAAKDAILDHRARVDTEELRSALLARRATHY